MTNASPLFRFQSSSEHEEPKILEILAMAALQYLETQRKSPPELSEWYNTLELEKFVALAVFQVRTSFSTSLSFFLLSWLLKI